MKWTVKNRDMVMTSDSRAGRVLLRDGHTSVPRAFTLSGRPPVASPGITVEIDVELDRWAHPSCTRAEFKADDGVALTAETLRVPLRRLVNEAMEFAALQLRHDGPTPDGGSRYSPLLPDEQSLAVEQVRQTIRKSGRPLTAAHFERVAQLYNEALQADWPPTRHVAREMGAPYSTAARWVSRARQEGALAPPAG